MHVSTLTWSHLHICVAGCPEEVGDARPPHRGGHRLARGLDAGQQLRQVSCNVNTIIYLLFLFYLLPEVKSLGILLVFDLLYTIYPPLRKNVQFHRQRKLLKCKLATFDITNIYLK